MNYKANGLQEELKQSIRELKQKQIDTKLAKALDLIKKAEEFLTEAMRTEFDLRGNLKRSKCSAAFGAAAKNIANKSKESL
jgi:hypothetical protein